MRHRREHRDRRLAAAIMIILVVGLTAAAAPAAVGLIVAGPATVHDAVVDAVPALEPGGAGAGEDVAVHPHAPAEPRLERAPVEEGGVVLRRPLEVRVHLGHQVRRRRRRLQAPAAATPRQAVQRPPDQRHPLPRGPVVLGAEDVPGVQRDDFLEPACRNATNRNEAKQRRVGVPNITARRRNQGAFTLPEDVDVGRRRGAEPVVEAERARRRAATYIPRSSKDPALKTQEEDITLTDGRTTDRVVAIATGLELTCSRA